MEYFDLYKYKSIIKIFETVPIWSRSRNNVTSSIRNVYPKNSRATMIYETAKFYLGEMGVICSQNMGVFINLYVINFLIVLSSFFIFLFLEN